MILFLFITPPLLGIIPTSAPCEVTQPAVLGMGMGGGIHTCYDKHFHNKYSQ